MSYNGWSNYETWAVNLWLSNDEGSYTYWKERAEEVKDVYELSRELKSEIEQYNPLEEVSVYSDLLSAAISEIDFYEIAEAMLEDIAETA